MSMPLHPSSELWRDPKTKDLWRVHFEWAVIDGRAEPSSVQVQALEGRRVTAEIVRRIPLGTIIAEQRRGHRELYKRVAKDRQRYTAADRRALDERAKQFGVARRGRTLGTDELAEVARVYREAHQAGEPVVQNVADAFYISTSAAAKRIAAARRQGVLGPAVGTKSGEQAPTPKRSKR